MALIGPNLLTCSHEEEGAGGDLASVEAFVPCVAKTTVRLEGREGIRGKRMENTERVEGVAVAADSSPIALTSRAALWRRWTGSGTAVPLTILYSVVGEQDLPEG